MQVSVLESLEGEREKQVKEERPFDVVGCDLLMSDLELPIPSVISCKKGQKDVDKEQKV
jgi:hypothetical protein